MEGVTNQPAGPDRWGGYHWPVYVETDVGPLHHYQRRGGAENNMIYCSDVFNFASIQIKYVWLFTGF